MAQHRITGRVAAWPCWSLTALKWSMSISTRLMVWSLWRWLSCSAVRALSLARSRAKMELTMARTKQAAQAANASLGWQRDEVYVAYGRRVQA